MTTARSLLQLVTVIALLALTSLATSDPFLYKAALSDASPNRLSFGNATESEASFTYHGSLLKRGDCAVDKDKQCSYGVAV